MIFSEYTVCFFLLGFSVSPSITSIHGLFEPDYDSYYLQRSKGTEDRLSSIQGDDHCTQEVEQPLCLVLLLVLISMLSQIVWMLALDHDSRPMSP